ncbi:hypothetical protein RRG08_048204, partial [Elysia crispata]
ALTQGQEMTFDRDVFLEAEEGDSCGQLTCSTRGNLENIDSVTMRRTKPSGVCDELLSITRESPHRVVSLDSFRANGTLEDNTAQVTLDLVEMSSCRSDYFTCEVTFTRRSGETGKAFSMSGPGESPSCQREGKSDWKTRENGPSSSPPAKSLSNPYISEIWFLGEKIIKIEGKFTTLSDRLERRMSQSVKDVHDRTSSLENSVMERVTSSETGFSERISRLEDRVASSLLSQSQSLEERPVDPGLLEAVERRLDDMTLVLEGLDVSTSTASQEGELQDKPVGR